MYNYTIRSVIDLNEKLKKFKYVKFLVNAFCFAFLIAFGGFVATKLPSQLYELDFVYFFLSLAIILILFGLLFYIICFTSIIMHEFGHLLFGLNAKLTFISFNILSFTFCIENNKLKIKKEAKIPGVLGYCNMTTEKNKKYNKNSIKLYYMGGIIFNIILVFISIVLIIFTNNIYLKLIYILNVGINIYLAINNAIPTITKSGVNTDALQIIYYSDDEEYINTMSKLQMLQILLAKGCELKNIDNNLFSNPQTFKTNSDVLNAMLYVDYLSAKKQYKKASEYAKKILEEAQEILSKKDIMTLKLQLMNCIFYSNDDLNQIKKIYDEEIKKYLDLMGKAVPVYIGISYMYSTLIEKNEENSKKYLNQFRQLNKKNYDKYMIEEAEQLINDVNKKKEEENFEK